MCYDLKKGSVWIVLLAILVWIAQPVAGQVKAATSLVLNLRNYGWEPPDRHQVETPSIVVDHEGRVLVGFTVSERKGLVTRTQPSLSFRIIRFSANGEADLSLSLPTNAAGRTALYLSDTDQIIARANDNLQVVQPSERDVQERVWKLLTACTPRWHIEQSFSRHTLLLFTEEADPVTLIHLSQPPVVRSCGKGPKVMNSDEDKVQNWPSSITDEFSYFLGGGEAYRWPFCDYEHRVELPLNAQGRWTVLNDKLLIVDTYDFRKNQQKLEVISSDGRSKFRWDMVKHESADTLWAPIRGSERGDRIAVDILTTRGGNRTLDISSHVTARRVAVYDIEAGKELASVPVNPKHRYRYEFDLSPDGHRLAILEDDTVKIVYLDQPAQGINRGEHADTVDLKNGNLHVQVPVPAVGKPKPQTP